MKSIIKLFIISHLFTFSLHASTVSIPLKANDHSMKPPSDLTYQGKQLDTYQALELAEQGLDLSTLNPYESHLWQNKKHEIFLNKINTESIEFVDFKNSPTEYFRAQVKNSNNTHFTLTASLNNHTNIIRAVILRKLGYDIALPKFYKKLKISFATEDDKNKFIEKIGEDTLTKRTRWIDREIDTTTVIFKDITLEPAKLENVNIFLPVMSRERQKQRRVFRSLLLIYTLTDFPQSINAVSWKSGRVFNQFLLFNHPYASSFRETTIDDILWIFKRLAKLEHSDLYSAVDLAGYPKDITLLIIEKLKARINSYAQHLHLPLPFDQVERNLTFKNIVNGNLIKDAYPEYVNQFYKEETDSPYDRNNLFKLFRSELTYNALSEVLRQAVKKFVPGFQIDNAIDNIQENILEYRMKNPGSNGKIPLKTFAAPTAYANTNATRNIIFGKHLGQTAPIQLVDTISAEVNLGVFSMITGIDSKVIPSVAASVSMTRSYTHVRAMPDLETASKQSITKLLIPRLMKSIGGVIATEFKCSLQGSITVTESTIDDNEVYYIKYDLAVSGAKQKAIKKRTELIDQGIDEGKILLVPVNKKEECDKEVKELRSQNLEKFLKEFALNETFIINDSIALKGDAKANIPLTTYLNQQLSMSLGAGINKGILRGVLIRKKENGLVVSIDQNRNSSTKKDIGLNFFIEILRGSKRWLTGDKNVKFYFIPTEGIEDSEKHVVLKTLHQLFTSNSTSYLEQYYAPIKLQNDLEGRLNSLKVLWHKRDHMRYDNKVQVVLPEAEHPNLNLLERTKHLYATNTIYRHGNSYLGFLNSVFGYFNDYVQLGQDASDPGQTLKGHSKSRYYISEADITAHKSEMITTKIDYIWQGWSAKFNKLNQIFNYIEYLFGAKNNDYHINRELFKNHGALKGYKVQTTLIIYPKFYNIIKRDIINTNYNQAMMKLKSLYGSKDWAQYCRKKSAGPRKGQTRKCTPLGVKTMLKLRGKQLSHNPILKTKEIHHIIKTLFESFDRAAVINWLGKDVLFASTRITGFLEGSEKGYVDYISNSYGKYDKYYGSGIFDHISSLLGIGTYELRALNITPGM